MDPTPVGSGGSQKWGSGGAPVSDKPINLLTFFRPIFGPSWPTAGPGNPGNESGLKCCAGRTTNRPRRPNLRPTRIQIFISGVGRTNITRLKMNLRSFKVIPDQCHLGPDLIPRAGSYDSGFGPRNKLYIYFALPRGGLSDPPPFSGGLPPQRLPYWGCGLPPPQTPANCHPDAVDGSDVPHLFGLVLGPRAVSGRARRSLDTY